MSVPLTQALAAMNKIVAILLLLVGSLFSFRVSACHRISPDRDSLGQYSAVFLGRVTGIHLDGYENHLLGKGDANLGGQLLTITDGSTPVSVTTVVSRAIRGAPTSPLRLQLVGCTKPLPVLKQRGLFFVARDGQSAVTIWESDSRAFSNWVKLLRVQPDSR